MGVMLGFEGVGREEIVCEGVCIGGGKERRGTELLEVGSGEEKGGGYIGGIAEPEYRLLRTRLLYEGRPLLLAKGDCI